MAKISLISCNITQDPYPVYPLGMTMIAEAARAQGHEVQEWDMNAQGSDPGTLQSFISASQPDYVGLSLRNVDSANFNKPDAYIDGYKVVVQTVRQATDAPIILGGSAYTIFPREILKAVKADYGVAGEGEAVFCQLIDQLETDPDAAYPIYYNNPHLGGNEFSALNRNAELAQFYLQRGGMLSVQTKRGCPHRCIYCSYPILEGKQYRFRPAEDVVDEIEALVNKYQADYYAITDSVFNDATGHYLEIAEELVRRNINVPWMCFLRPDNFRKSDVELLRRAGLNAIEWGTDCATDETLAAMHKDFTWDQIVHSNNLFAEYGVSNAHFIIFGGPDETYETLDVGLKNLMSLDRCVIFGGIGVRIFPGTAMYTRALDEGVIHSDQNLLPPTYYFSDKVDTDTMHEKILQAFGNRLDRIYPDGQYVDTALSLHLMGHRGPAWDMLLNQNIKR